MIIFEEIETIAVGAGVVCNFTLLYLIKRFSRKELGTYKYLLAVFASFDGYLSIAHGIAHPKILIINTTFGCVPKSIIHNKHFSSVFFGSFTVPFALLNVHLLYRYWTVTNPTRIALFSRIRSAICIAAYPAGTLVAWYFMALATVPSPDDPGLAMLQEQFREMYNETIDEGWMVLDHWRYGRINNGVSLLILIAASIIMVSNFGAASSFAWITYRSLSRSDAISVNYKSFQLQMLGTALIQTFVPLVLVGIPYGVVLYFPFLGISVGRLVDIFPLLMSLFPAWDAIVIICLIKDYRQGFLSLFGWRKTQVTELLTASEMTTRLQTLSGGAS